MKNKFVATWSRKLHRWATVFIAVPFLVILVTGLFLQWKKDIDWIQPPTKSSTAATNAPLISLDQMLAAVQSVDEAAIASWEDVDRLDVRPDKGVVKVRGVNRWEVQVDLRTGDVLHVAYRRSDLIESIHDGSWFHDKAKLWLFFPVALVLLGLYLTGVYLFYLPYQIRWSRKPRPKRKRRFDKVKPVLPPSTVTSTEDASSVS